MIELQEKIIFILLISCCECAVLLKKASRSSKHSSSPISEYKRFKTEIIRNLTESNHSSYLMKLPKIIKSKMKNILSKYFYEFFPLPWHHKVNDASSNEQKGAAESDITSYMKMKQLLSLSNDVNQVKSNRLVSFDEVMLHHLNYSDINENVLNQFDLIFNNDNAEYLILNKTGIDESKIMPKVPECEWGNNNCTVCREISPYCHYMFSEERCVYYNSTHSSELYECGKRWFPVDRNEVLFSVIAILMLVTSGAVGCVIWLRLHIDTVEEAEALEAEELEEMRIAVETIRKKRFPHRRWSAEPLAEQEIRNEHS